MTAANGLTFDPITCDDAVTLPGLFLRRCERTPDVPAYRQFEADSASWKTYTWKEAAARVARWQASLAREGFAPGDRVAVALPNGVDWVCFDLAAQSLGLVVVPLYTTDNPQNMAWILGDCGARLLLALDVPQWKALAPHRALCPALSRVLCVRNTQDAPAADGVTLSLLPDWLAQAAGPFEVRVSDPGALASIVYTSGTTGKPKGVMLSHRNILWNAEAVMKVVKAYREDVYLSFLPLAHTFERTVGYYIPVMTGGCVAYARSLQTLAQDLLSVRPTVLVSVPRIYDQVYAKLQLGLARKGGLARALFRQAVDVGWKRFERAQGRGAGPGALGALAWPLLDRLVAGKILERLGGRLRLAVCGGAPLNTAVARTFLGLGLPVLQGYGLTEASPIVTGNRLEDNLPESVGLPLPGVEVKLGEGDELLTRSPSVMQGYWNNPEATRQAVDAEGWLHTGDLARIDARGHVFIVGRLKEILVMSSGEKVPPADLEMAITQDPLFDQAMVLGEGKPYIAALLVLNPEAWTQFAAAAGVAPDDPAALASRLVHSAVMKKLRELLAAFPGYARVHAVWLTLQPWTIDDDLITPTLKLKRPQMERRFAAEIHALFARHAIPEIER